MRSNPKGGMDCDACDGVICAMVAELEQVEQDRVGPFKRQRRLADSELLRAEGEACNHAYVVLDGVLALSKELSDGRRHISDFRYPGELVTAGVDQAFWPADIRSTRVSCVCEIDLRPLHNRVTLRAQLHQHLAGIARAEIERYHEHMMCLACKRSLERVCSFLFFLTKRQRINSQNLRLTVARDAIAEHLGITPETVSRLFSWLKSNEIIVLPKPTEIQIRDVKQLRVLAQIETDD